VNNRRGIGLRLSSFGGKVIEAASPVQALT